MPLPAARIERLPRYVFDIIGESIRALQQRGIDVYRLDIGNPDMPPPPAIIETLAEAARNPRLHGYSGYRGTPEYRRAVARYYQRRYGVDLQPDTEVLPLIGSKEGIVNLSLAYLDHGDLALVPDVGYPSYSMGAYLAGAEVHWLPMRPESGFLPDLHNIPPDVLSRAKILWLNYPNNPTSAVAPLSFYEQAVAFCARYGLLLASDNPYNDIVFDGYTAPSPLQIPGAKDFTVEFMSLSKSHNMAGWRMGAVVGSSVALGRLLQIKSNVDSGHFLPIYEAATMALDEIPDAWIAERNAIYQRRRDLLLAALPQMGLAAPRPLATLYTWATPLDMPAADYLRRALDEAHVSLGPGAAYGPGGENNIRISISLPDARFEEAVDRLVTWYTRRGA
ncbi:MAG: aminotransferase class I/II-fold pyridoxal phosphate-dependent enzyme [Anaerolineae bacterium]|nr:aminotransferase class I/II-fold pyridoxal phosphate-dependent enzyme [Anaerolineae bacterium]